MAQRPLTPLADLVVALVVRSIEATAASAPWSDFVRLAPGSPKTRPDRSWAG